MLIILFIGSDKREGGGKTLAIIFSTEHHSLKCNMLCLIQIKVPHITTICIDLGNLADVEEIFSKLGDIHLLVNNAGIGLLEPFTEVTEKAFDT